MKSNTGKTNSPSSTIRQAERDRFMKRYLNGCDIEDSPSEIYSQNWKERRDGNLVSGGKYSGGNNIINKNGEYYGNQEYLYHPGEDDEYYGRSAWFEPTHRKKLGNVTPEDIDNLKRIDTERIRETKANKDMKKNVVKINENTLRKIVAESVKKVVNEWRDLTASEIEWRDIERKRDDEKHAREMDDLTAKSKMAKKWFSKANNQRLSENTLRQIVAESVKNILSEIDWKTYQNAADKAYRMGDKDRAEKFTKAAMDRFKEDYGDDNTEVYPDTQGNQPDFHYVQNLPDKSGDFQDIRWIDNGKYGGWGSFNWPNPEGNPFYSVPKSHIKNNDKLKANSDTFDKMDDEFKKHIGNNNVWHRNSQYTYDNEKGWHLKESVEKAVNTVLKEYLNKKK